MSEEFSDEWLYGETAAGTVNAENGTSAAIDTSEEKSEEEPKDVETDAEVAAGEDKTVDEESPSKDDEAGAGEEVVAGAEPEGSEEDDDDSDDSEDDGVEVTIGDIKAETLAAQNASFGAKRAAGPPPDKKGKFSTEEFDGTGTINGVPAQDFSLDSLEDKPWRKPGADITDYFNYGFSEETWRSYCDRQKRLRLETGNIIQLSGDREKRHQQPHQSNISIIGGGDQQRGQQNNIIFPKKFGQQQRDMPFQRIPRNREEPRENTIQVMTADRREYSRKNFDMPMGMPPPFDMSVPPPGPGHFNGPPPDGFHGPPPPEFYGHGPPPPFFPGDGPPPMHGMHPPPHGMMHPPPRHMDYEEQQWMDSSWDPRMNQPPMSSVNTVIPIHSRGPNLPPPPGESDDLDKDSIKTET